MARLRSSTDPAVTRLHYCSRQQRGSSHSIPPLPERHTWTAFTAALIVGRLSHGADMGQVAAAVRLAPPPLALERAPDLLLDGLALLVTEGRAVATPILRKALSAFTTKKSRLRKNFAGFGSQDA